MCNYQNWWCKLSKKNDIICILSYHPHNNQTYINTFLDSKFYLIINHILYMLYYYFSILNTNYHILNKWVIQIHKKIINNYTINLIELCSIHFCIECKCFNLPNKCNRQTNNSNKFNFRNHRNTNLSKCIPNSEGLSLLKQSQGKKCINFLWDLSIISKNNDKFSRIQIQRHNNQIRIHIYR